MLKDLCWGLFNVLRAAIRYVNKEYHLKTRRSWPVVKKAGMGIRMKRTFCTLRSVGRKVHNGNTREFLEDWVKSWKPG